MKKLSQSTKPSKDQRAGGGFRFGEMALPSTEPGTPGHRAQARRNPVLCIFYVFLGFPAVLCHCVESGKRPRHAAPMGTGFASILTSGEAMFRFRSTSTDRIMEQVDHLDDTERRQEPQFARRLAAFPAMPNRDLPRFAGSFDPSDLEIMFEDDRRRLRKGQSGRRCWIPKFRFLRTQEYENGQVYQLAR